MYVSEQVHLRSVVQYSIGKILTSLAIVQATFDCSVGNQNVHVIRNIRRTEQPRPCIHGVENQPIKNKPFVLQQDDLNDVRSQESDSTSPTQMSMSASGGTVTFSCIPCVSENTKMRNPLYRIIITKSFRWPYIGIAIPSSIKNWFPELSSPYRPYRTA